MNKLYLLILVFFIYASQTANALETVVVPVDRFLVQGVPRFNLDKFKAEDIITSSDDKKFRVNPFATKFLSFLKDEKINIVYVSNLTKEKTISILEKIKLNNKESAENISSRVITLEDLEDVDEKKVLNISSLGIEKEDLLIVNYEGSFLEEVSKGIELNLEKTYFAYNSFNESKSAWEKSVSRGDSQTLTNQMPNKFETWFNDNYKIAYAYLLLRESLEESKDAISFITKLEEKLDEDRNTLTKISVDIINGVYKENSFVLELNKEKTKAIGCNDIETRTQKVISKVHLSKCIEGKEYRYFWQGKEKNNCLAFLKDQDVFLFEEATGKNCENQHAIESDKGFKFISLFFIDGELVEYIPEIMELNDYDVIPKEIFRKYDSKLIAMSIIKRKHEKYEEKSSDTAYDYMQDSEVIISFKGQYFSNIQKSCFLNQHQISQSGGTFDPKRRANVEDRFIGIRIEKDYSKKTNYDDVYSWVRPIYSYLQLSKNHHGLKTSGFSTQYGNVFARLNNSVKQRSTFSLGDSLLMEYSYKSDVRQYIHTFFSRPKREHKKIEDRYNETHVWGKTCLSDVDYFLVNCGNGFSDVSSSVLSSMKKTKIDIYKCKAEINGNGEIIRVFKGKKLN